MGKIRDFLFPTKEKDTFETTTTNVNEINTNKPIISSATILDDDAFQSSGVHRLPPQETLQNEENHAASETALNPNENLLNPTFQEKDEEATLTNTITIHNIPQIYKPKAFAGVEELGLKLLEGKPIIVSLVDTDREISRRICDFLNGLCFALNGSVEKVEKRIYLFSPTKDE